MDAVLLIADNDARRRNDLRQFFRASGFLTMAVANGLECMTGLRALEPDVLVISADIPWGGADGVMARLNEGLVRGRKPFVFVVGDEPVEAMAARTGADRCNCFSLPLRKERLLDRIALLLAAGLLHVAQHWSSLRRSAAACLPPGKGGFCSQFSQAGGAGAAEERSPC